MTTLRDRCRQFLDEQMRHGITRTGDPVNFLMGFVLSEFGKQADGRLENCSPVVLYFAKPEDRAAFIAAVREIKPDMQMMPYP